MVLPDLGARRAVLGISFSGSYITNLYTHRGPRKPVSEGYCDMARPYLNKVEIIIHFDVYLSRYEWRTIHKRVKTCVLVRELLIS